MRKLQRHHKWAICAAVVTAVVATPVVTSVNNAPSKVVDTSTTNSAVTQATIQQTICKSGYTRTIRPSVGYTNQLKLVGIKAYGYADTNPANYEEDHAISLEIGGSPTSPKNLWPEPIVIAKQDDQVENQLNKKVCSGQLTLAQGQAQELQLKVSHGYKQ